MKILIIINTIVCLIAGGVAGYQYAKIKKDEVYANEGTLEIYYMPNCIPGLNAVVEITKVNNIKPKFNVVAKNIYQYLKECKEKGINLSPTFVVNGEILKTHNLKEILTLYYDIDFHTKGDINNG